MQQAKKSAEAATKKAETADLEYRDAVKQLQASQQKFYQDEMPKVLDVRPSPTHHHPNYLLIAY